MLRRWFSRQKNERDLFQIVDPSVDGPDCLTDCNTCQVRYPPGFKIDEESALYGQIDGWDVHLIVATSKSDWRKHIEEEPGSLMKAVRQSPLVDKNLMLSASNMLRVDSKNPNATSVLILPSCRIIDHVTPPQVDDLLQNHVLGTSTNTSPMTVDDVQRDASSDLFSRDCPHKYLILMCSQRSRDARCGQSAPLLRKEFERHLRPLGLYRDLQDERPGGVGIYFISHVGGHKFSANVLVYRRVEKSNGQLGEAEQCIWLARVRPEHCQAIVQYTVVQGKVVHPSYQLRGGFDRAKGLVSW